MNWAAFFAFAHPLAAVLICGLWILSIIKKEYPQKVHEQEHSK